MKDPAPSETSKTAPIYELLCRKVDEFADSAQSEDPESFQCQAGCAACCHVSLTVSPLEASRVSGALRKLSPATQKVLLSRAESAESEGRCVMLNDNDQCTIYDSRPLVCRSQGLALSYPRDVVPLEAVFAKLPDGRDITWCPLNYTATKPKPSHVLDAEQIDTVLAGINQQFSEESDKTTALSRISLVALVRKAW